MTHDLFGDNESSILAACKQRQYYMFSTDDTDVESEPFIQPLTSRDRIQHWIVNSNLLSDTGFNQTKRNKKPTNKKSETTTCNVFFANISVVSHVVITYVANLKDKHIVGLLETHVIGFKAETLAGELKLAGWNSIQSQATTSV